MSAHLVHGGGGWSVVAGLSLVAMWFTMMAAMMAPVAWPWIAAFRRFDLHARDSNRAAATAAFIGGYGVAWLFYSTLAAALQIFLAAATGFDGASGFPSSLVAVVLVGAGLVQFSPLKRGCLTHCRNPFGYFLARWQDGPTPSWRIGFGHGLFCIGCCWALMSTTLVVGMMNLWWMAAIAVATFAEQVTRSGDLARTAIGIALVGAGVLAAFA